MTMPKRGARDRVWACCWGWRSRSSARRSTRGWCTASEVSNGLGLPLLGRLWEAPRTVRRQDALVTVAEP